MNKVYEIVTNKICDMIENGTAPWVRGWSRKPAVSHTTGKSYSFLNQMLLGANGGEYLTYKQCEAEGGKVKKSESGSFVVFFKFREEEVKDENGETVLSETGDALKRKIPMLRYYYVFEVGQCEGIERKYPPKMVEHKEPIEEAEAVINTYLNANPSLKFTEGVSNKAYYSPSQDMISIPAREQFETLENFYATAFHEMVHSTMKEDRCNRTEERFGKNVAFGSEEYSKEELVAEIGAAFLCDIVNIDATQNASAYLKGWLKPLKDDVTLIVSAASRAEKAVDYILGEEDEEN